MTTNVANTSEALSQQMRTIVDNQRRFFRSHATRSADFRLEQLTRLQTLLHEHEDELYEAIFADFGKSRHHTEISETISLFSELETAIKNVKKWVKPRSARTNLPNKPGKSYIVPEPLGTALVIGAWNLPYNLSLVPVIGSMVAGNTTVLKPSELPARTSAFMARLINENFDPGYLHVVEGAIPETTALLEQRWDKIFFTGSPQVGKIVNKAAAANLTNVTLELGGKNPAIFAEDANVEIGIKRLVWAKFINSGQLCIAPDYLLVHESIKDQVIERIVHEIEKHQYSVEHGNAVQIINTRNFDRLSRMMDPDKIVYGGQRDREQRFIHPTVMHDVTTDDAIMQEEVFGPIIPVLTFETLDEAFDIVHGYEKPLAGYMFTNDKATKQRFIDEIPFGSGAINDAVMQVANEHLPFGGVGNSGMGRYHGEYSFECFSHFKPVLDKPAWFEPDLKYYGHSDRQIKILKRLS